MSEEKETQGRDVVHRADSLMRHRRSFVARGPARPTAAAASADPAEDDVPLLTEVVRSEAPLADPEIAGFDETLISILAADLARSIEARLADELPALVSSALRKLEEELHQQVAAATESALRDFLAHRERLRRNRASHPAEP